jgi:hypothetical protein
MRAGSAAGAVALTGALVVALAGCQASSQSAEPEPTIAMMPSANAFSSAVSFTRGLGTGRLAIRATTTVDSVTTERSGTATAAFDPKGYGIATWTDGSAVVVELANEKSVFARPTGSGELWTPRPEDATSLSRTIMAPLTGLGELAEVRSEGSTDLGGTPTTRYSGRLPADPDRLRALGFDAADLAAIGEEWRGTAIDVVVWVDGNGRVVRVDRSIDLPAAAASASTSTTITDFTAALDLTNPPTASVAPPTAETP